MAAPYEISPKNLSRLIGTPTCPVIIDVSIDADVAEDPFLIPTAQRHPHTEFASIVDRLQGTECVIVCQKGLKLSQGFASRLRGHGIAAQVLEGGNYGWRAMADAPRVAIDTLAAASLWVTRHRPKIDRIACPWFIRRFINPEAEFLFVAPDAVAGVSEKYGATAFDSADAPFGHRGDLCTFDALLDHFDLRTAPLDRLSQIVRAADTGRAEDSPQAAGLLAVSLGLSRMHKDDHSQLDAAMPVYDALYRWARDAQAETHASFGDAP